MARPAVVELARAAVRRLADAPPTADAALDALALIERVGLGPPYTVAIAGEPAARAALLDQLAGAHLFQPSAAPATEDGARVVLTLRHGPVTLVRARRRDGTLEEHTLGGTRAPTADITAAAAATADAATDTDAAADAATDGRSPSAAAANRSPSAAAANRSPSAAAANRSPSAAAAPVTVEAEPTEIVRRPAWWAFWSWIALWLHAWRTRPRRPARLSLSAALAGPSASSSSTATTTAATTAPASAPAITTARRALARTVQRARRGRDPWRPLAETLRGWRTDDTVERIFVEITDGPLPDKVVVIELPSRADARSLDAVAADACIVACGDTGFTLTRQLEVVLTIVPHLFAATTTAAALPVATHPSVRRLAGADAVAPALAQIATIERALAVGRRAVAVLAAGAATLDRAITAAETDFRLRIEHLEALRIPSPDSYTADALARIKPGIVEHTHQRIRRAVDQLDETIARFSTEWAARLAAAGSTDALRTAAAQLDDESPGALQAAQAEVHRVLVADLSAHAQAHFRDLTADLRRGDAPVPAWLTVDVQLGDMTSGTKLGAVAPRLTSLFRSLDALRTDAVAQLDQRVAKLRQVASANLQDAEPRLEPAVTGALAIALRGEVERHATWLESELARERLSIDAERAQLASLAHARDTARTDHRQLTSALDALASELP